MTLACLRRQPKQQRSKDRVELILNAAAALLDQAGPAGTTITAVAGRTGLATSSIYDYVEGERQLIGAVAERGLDMIHSALVEIIGTPASVEDLGAALSDGLRLFLRQYQAEPGLREALAFIDADPVLTEINMADTRRNAAVIAQAIAPLRPGVDLSHAVFLVTYLTGALAGLAARVDDEEAVALIAQFEQMMTVFLFAEPQP